MLIADALLTLRLRLPVFSL